MYFDIMTALRAIFAHIHRAMRLKNDVKVDKYTAIIHPTFAEVLTFKSLRSASTKTSVKF